MSRLKQLFNELKKDYPTCYNITYDYHENGAVLEDGWLLQSPNVWGMKASTVNSSAQPWHPPGENINSDFGLPICNSSNKCGNGNAKCEVLEATVKKPGDQAEKLCLGHSDKFVDSIYKIMIKAKRSVHITTLGPAPDKRFMAAMCNAVTYLAHTGQQIEITLMIGYLFPLLPKREAYRTLENLIKEARGIGGSKISVRVIVYGSAIHWNHSKIIVVDGFYSIVGGHNWYFNSYLQKNPVFDLSMQLSGPISKLAETYVREAWLLAAKMHHGVTPNGSEQAHAWEYVSIGKSNEIREINLKDFDFLVEPGIVEEPLGKVIDPLAVPVLAVGRLNDKFPEAPGDEALVRLLHMAKESIKISQQNLGYFPKPFTRWNNPVNEVLVEFIIKKKKDVYIVQSYNDAGDYFSYQWIPQLVRDLFDRAKKANPDLKDGYIWDLLNKHLHVAPLRFSEDKTWTGNKDGIANHSKFIMIDDEIFYIGSQNLYPPGPQIVPAITRILWRLKEFGYIIESKKAAAEVNEQYWNKLVEYSKPMRVKLTTNKTSYKAGEDISFHLIVENRPPNNDTIVAFRESNGEELSWFKTNNESNGDLSEKWRVQNWMKGDKIIFRYCHEGLSGGMKIFIDKTIVSIEN